jgi:hypothetical protein
VVSFGAKHASLLRPHFFNSALRYDVCISVAVGQASVEKKSVSIDILFKTQVTLTGPFPDCDGAKKKIKKGDSND